LAAATPAALSAFASDLRLATTISQGASTTSRDRARATDAVWTKCWIPLLFDVGIEDPFLFDLDDKIPLLRVFSTRIRDGRLSRSHKPVRAAHVRDEVLHVAKVFTELGAPDPRIPGSRFTA
jgi:hypothetical protein